MSSSTGLNSRNSQQGLVERTVHNLDRIILAFADGEQNLHPVTQLLNSLLVMLVWVHERQPSFIDAFNGLDLSGPDPVVTQNNLNRALGISTITLIQWRSCNSFRDFIRRLRNAISHARVTFDSESSDFTAVTLNFKDGPPQNPHWEVTIRADDIDRLVRFFANELANPAVTFAR